MEKLKHRMIKELSQGQIPRKWQNEATTPPPKKKSDSIAHTQRIHSPSMMELKMLRCFGVAHLESNLLFASSQHWKNTKVGSSSLVNILVWSWISLLPMHTLKKFSYKTQVQLGRVRKQLLWQLAIFPTTLQSPYFRHTHNVGED